MESIILTWDELVNRYDDDQQSFEEYFCNEMGIELKTDPDDEGFADLEAMYAELETMYADKMFIVRPNADYIRYRGVINSDFSISERV